MGGPIGNFREFSASRVTGEDDDTTVVCSDGNTLAIGAYGERTNAHAALQLDTLQAVEARGLAGRHAKVPRVDLAVLVASNHRDLGWMNLGGVDGRGCAGVEGGHGLSARVPDAHCGVLRSGEQPLAVVVVAKSSDVAAMTVKRRENLARALASDVKDVHVGVPGNSQMRSHPRDRHSVRLGLRVRHSATTFRRGRIPEPQRIVISCSHKNSSVIVHVWHYLSSHVRTYTHTHTHTLVLHRDYTHTHKAHVRNQSITQKKKNFFIMTD